MEKGTIASSNIENVSGPFCFGFPCFTARATLDLKSLSRVCFF